MLVWDERGVEGSFLFGIYITPMSFTIEMYALSREICEIRADCEQLQHTALNTDIGSRG